MGKIIFLPLDERPCNYKYPEYIGKISGMDMEIVPREYMGDFKKAADTERIWEWTRQKAGEGDTLIVALDLWVYGGIVPSRLHHIQEKECEKRLWRLKKLKKEISDLKIFGFQLITRAPARDGSSEEPEYYEEYGYRIYRYGVLSDKEELGLLTEEEKREKARIQGEIPKEVLKDFLERREMNFRNNCRAIQLAAEGVIDFLVIPLDDCREYGYAPSERRRLAACAAAQNMLSRIYFYPGADEVGCTLLARAINENRKEPLRVFLDYSSLRGKYQIPSYEDRSIGETAQYQLLAAGCQIVEEAGEAGAVLAINPPTPFSLRLKKELVTEKIYLESERNLPAFTARIERYLEKGLLCGIADCAIPNAADRALMQFLYEKGMLEKIHAYGGWNTSSNTLGTVIGHLTALFGRKGEQEQKLSEEFLFFRYLEDWGYMALVRKKAIEELKKEDPLAGMLDLRAQQPKARKLVKKGLEKFQENYFPESDWKWEISMPWNRMFEIEIHGK